MNKISTVRMPGYFAIACAPLFRAICFSSLCLSVHVGAAELVGKPVPVGKPVIAASSPAVNTAVSSAATSPAAQLPAEPAPPVGPVPPVDPLPPPVDLDSDTNPFKNPFNQGDEDPFNNHSWGPDLLIPIVAMSLLFGGPVLLVIVLAFFYYRAKARRQQNINANIDKLLAAGRDIPVELLLGDDAPLIKSGQPNGQAQVTYPDIDGMMHKGVRNIGLGTGWLLFLTVMFGFKIGSFGFIFIGLGISQVVIWLLSGSRRKAAPAFTLDAERVED